jgi:3-mercaptopyruvate sulfurtransferase SseA
VVIVCNEGYGSSLAAATLQDLGIRRATDLVGGFRAWKAAGLPICSATAEYGHVARAYQAMGSRVRRWSTAAPSITETLAVRRGGQFRSGA